MRFDDVMILRRDYVEAGYVRLLFPPHGHEKRRFQEAILLCTQPLEDLHSVHVYEIRDNDLMRHATSDENRKICTEKFGRKHAAYSFLRSTSFRDHFACM